ncbi:MAG: hypothetical protein P4L50_21670 [Anaerolineaceae bacterium]|nr:hypothetical protein [Anaerolineaceae bacterium]
MEELRQFRAKVRFLGGLILLGLFYSGWLHFHLHFTGIQQLDGIFGVLIGIYACAHPAANLLDMAIYHHGLPRQVASRNAYICWWALNIAVLLVGWVTIVTGLLRFSAAG